MDLIYYFPLEDCYTQEEMGNIGYAKFGGKESALRSW